MMRAVVDAVDRYAALFQAFNHLAIDPLEGGYAEQAARDA